MISDAELLKKLDEYRARNKWDWKTTARWIGVTPATLCNWKNGGIISSKGRCAIIAVTGPFDDADSLKLPDCPFLKIVLDKWENLTTQERAAIAGKVASLADAKKDSFMEDA